MVKRKEIWTATRNKSSVENAFAHFKAHGAEFGAQNSDYVKQTQNFLKNFPNDTLTKTRGNGDIIRYNFSTNTFAVMDKNNTRRTMFKPNPQIHGYLTNL